MPLISLPPELIDRVLKNLRAFEIEFVAQTFNRRLYAICKPLLKARLDAQHNARVMVSRFPQGGNDYGMDQLADPDIPKIGYEHSGLQDKHGPFVSNPSPNLEYLDLKGDLSWLKPLDARTAEMMKSYQSENVQSSTAQVLDGLKRDAQSVGITVPPCFYTLMLSIELQNHIASSTACYFSLSDRLLKCPPHLDGGAGGYLLQFYADQQGCYYWFLYFDTSGGHCILGTGDFIYSDENDPDDDDDDDDNDDLDEAGLLDKDKKDVGGEGKDISLGIFAGGGDPFMLIDTSFEHFLAITYFKQWLWFVATYGLDVPEPIKEYLINVHSKAGQEATNSAKALSPSQKGGD